MNEPINRTINRNNGDKFCFTSSQKEKENINKLLANKGRIKNKLVLFKTSKIINPIKKISPPILGISPSCIF